jgi:DNA-binding CsgD family transcriptional regulator
MADLLESKPADLIGRPCYKVVHNLSSPADFCPWTLAMKDRQGHSAEIFEDNLKGIFLISVSPLFDDQNNLIGGIHLARNISHLKQIEENLRKSNETLEQHVKIHTSELVKKAKDLEESNIALKVLLRQRDHDRAEIQDSLTHNIRELICPHLDQMEQRVLSKEELDASIREIRGALDNLTSFFPRFLSSQGLSPAEVRIAEMIRTGKNNKEIAELLSISDGTVRVHREHIRNKLGLKNRKINLESFLNSLHNKR